MKNTSTAMINASKSAKAIAKAKAKCERLIERLPSPEPGVLWLARAKTLEDFESLADAIALEYDSQMGQAAMGWLDKVGRSRTRGEEAVYAQILLKILFESWEELHMYRTEAERNKRKQLKQLKTNARKPRTKMGTK